MPPWKYLLYGAGQLGVMIVACYFFQWLIFFCEGRDTGKGALFSASVVGFVFRASAPRRVVADPLAGAFGDSWVKKGRERRDADLVLLRRPGRRTGTDFSLQPPTWVCPCWVFLSVGMFVFFVGYTLYAISYWALVEDYAEGGSLRARGCPTCWALACCWQPASSSWSAAS